MIVRRMLIAAFALSILCIATARAQTVRGVVVDPAGHPVAGAVLLLLDSAAATVGRAVSTTGGNFHVSASKPGAYRLRVLRIGYRPTTSEVLRLLAGGEITQRFVLTGVQVSLDTVRVVDRNACHNAIDSAAATFAVWEQARTALTATQVTATSRAVAATLVSYERTLDRNFRDVLTQSAKVYSGYVTQPWRSLSPDSLRRVGFVVAEPRNVVTYHAPGIDELLSGAFLEDHCFRIATSPDPRTIGIAFEPSSDRKLPEIQGTLWLDRASSELRRIDFKYVNLPSARQDRAGGEMEFVRMAGGEWAISRWNIHMPVLEEVAIKGITVGTETRVAEFHVTGGELSVIRRGSDTLWARAPLVLTGIVTDSASRAPVAGAWVTVRGTTHAAVTDSAGEFAIPGLLPGEYGLEIRTAALDSVGVINQVALAFVDSATPVQIRVQRPVIAGAVFSGAVLIDSTKTPIAGAEVVIPDASKAALTDANGAFRITGIPAGEYRVVVRRLGYGPLDTRLKFANNRTLDRKVYLSRIVTLDSVVVTSTSTLAAMRDFEDNRRVGLGKFWTRADLEKYDNQSLFNVIAQTSGIAFVRGRGFHIWMSSTRGTKSIGNTGGKVSSFDLNLGAKQGVCYAQVYLDDAIVYRGRDDEPLFDLSSIAPAAIEAIEYYAGPSETPVKYTDLGSACGVLVIHTRRTP